MVGKLKKGDYVLYLGPSSVHIGIDRSSIESIDNVMDLPGKIRERDSYPEKVVVSAQFVAGYGFPAEMLKDSLTRMLQIYSRDITITFLEPHEQRPVSDPAGSTDLEARLDSGDRGIEADESVPVEEAKKPVVVLYGCDEVVGNLLKGELEYFGNQFYRVENDAGGRYELRQYLQENYVPLVLVADDAVQDISSTIVSGLEYKPSFAVFSWLDIKYARKQVGENDLIKYWVDANANDGRIIKQVVELLGICKWRQEARPSITERQYLLTQ